MRAQLTNAIKAKKDVPDSEAYWLEFPEHGVLAYTQRYAAVTHCPMDLHAYPCDQQLFPITFESFHWKSSDMVSCCMRAGPWGVQVHGACRRMAHACVALALSFFADSAAAEDARDAAAAAPRQRAALAHAVAPGPDRRLQH